MRNTTNHVAMSSEIFSVFALEAIRYTVPEAPDIGELLMASISPSISYLNDGALFMMASLMESEVQSCSCESDYDWLCEHGWLSFSNRLTEEKEARAKALSSATERMRMYDAGTSVMVDDTLNLSNDMFATFAWAALKQAVTKETGLSELVMAVIDANIQNIVQPTGNDYDDHWFDAHGWTEFSNHLTVEKGNRKASFRAENGLNPDSEEFPSEFITCWEI